MSFQTTIHSIYRHVLLKGAFLERLVIECGLYCCQFFISCTSESTTACKSNYDFELYTWTVIKLFFLKQNSTFTPFIIITSHKNHEVESHICGLRFNISFLSVSLYVTTFS